VFLANIHIIAEDAEGNNVQNDDCRRKQVVFDPIHSVCVCVEKCQSFPLPSA
jgi:hypothetical protein